MNGTNMNDGNLKNGNLKNGRKIPGRGVLAWTAMLVGLLVVSLTAGLVPAFAGEAPAAVKEMLKKLETQMANENPGFKGFNAVQGQEFFKTRRMNKKENEMISCASCHTEDPRKSGMSKANKPIKPLAPAANPEALTDRRNMEKWFYRNCTQVLERECTAQEKGDFLAFLLSVGV